MFQRSSQTALTFVAACVALLFFGCQSSTTGGASGGGGRNIGNQENANIQSARTPALDDAKKKREERTQQLKAMNVPQLAAEMERESQKGLEPFNSTSFAEAVARGAGAADELAAQIKKPDRSSLLGLVALHRINQERYRGLDQNLRVSALVDALKTSKNFNTWGLPHVKWEEAAQVLISEGQAAERQLLPLLSDERPAPVWGSEDYAEYERYKYRVRDYAWALLLAIRNQKQEIPESPAERDQLIKRAAPSATPGTQPG